MIKHKIVIGCLAVSVFYSFAHGGEDSSVSVTPSPVCTISHGEGFEKIYACFQEYKRTQKTIDRTKIIAGMNTLMQLGKLSTDKDTEEKIKEIINSIKATETFKIRVAEYLKRQKSVKTDENVEGLAFLGPILKEVILPAIAEEANVNDIKNMLQVSKGFNLAMLNAPVSIDLSGINISDAGIETIVQLFPNMKSLKLGASDHITNQGIVPLGILKNLQSLELNYLSQVNDLAPLKNLKNLQSLVLVYLPIHDLTPIGSLTNLTSLFLSTMKIDNIMPLVKLSSLTELNLVTLPEIKDLTPLVGLTKLTSLSLVDLQQVNDLAPLVGLTKLTSLSLIASQGINDITPLNNLVTLTSLNLELLPINVLPTIDKLRNLTSLTLSNLPEMTNIDSLGSLTNLTELSLYNLPQTNTINSLGSLTKLAVLNLIDIPVKNVMVLENLTSLQLLTFFGTGVSGEAISNLKMKLPNCEIRG